MKRIEREAITQVVFESIEEFNELYDTKVELKEGEETRLFGGREGALDSIGLVSLIVKIEEDIENKFDVPISLTSEKAMSRRTSPFAKVKYLIDYIEELIGTQKEAPV